VGNLSVGGTGKTPHVEYLLNVLHESFPVATLSRGYNRKTHGFYLADEKSTASEIGDEPMQFHVKFPQIAVAVGEERVYAIPQLLMEAPETSVVLLDDAFQHRSVKPGINILVTDYQHLFTRDHIVPFGRLRESRKGYKRADCIIVSKCPADMDEKIKNRLADEIDPLPHQHLFFSTLEYGQPYDFFTRSPLDCSPGIPVMLVSGIAKPERMEEFLQEHYTLFNTIRFPDHHYFTPDDIENICFHFNQYQASAKFIITTEKDAVRLQLLTDLLKGKSLPIIVLPVRVQFLFGQNELFNQYIFNYIKQYQEI
jgi:tetraacyldisaccharide 4'-kinase